MQTNLNKISSYFERIMQIADFYGYKNTNEFAKNALQYKSSEKINRLKNPSNKPSIDILLDISNKFEKINSGWLLTGRGSMLSKGSDNSISEESIEIKSDIVITKVLEMVKELSAENALLKQKLKALSSKKTNYGMAAEPGHDE